MPTKRVAGPTMSRLEAAQSVANEHGWGNVIRVEQGYGEQTAELRFDDGSMIMLSHLLSHEILRHPIDRPTKPIPPTVRRTLKRYRRVGTQRPNTGETNATD